MRKSMMLVLLPLAFGVTACEPKSEPTNEAGGNVAAAKAETETASIPCPFAGNKEWAGWINSMPGPGAQRTLIVTGQVDVAQDGYAGVLTPGALDKMNPPNQHFELTLVEKAGAKKGWQPVRGEVKPAGEGYNSAMIDCHGETLSTISPIEEAS